MLAQGLALVDEGVVDLMTLITRLTQGPARVLGLTAGSLSDGSVADLAVIDPRRAWTPGADTLRSAGLNTPLLGASLRGRCVMTLVEGRLCHVLDD